MESVVESLLVDESLRVLSRKVVLDSQSASPLDLDPLPPRGVVVAVEASNTAPLTNDFVNKRIVADVATAKGQTDEVKLPLGNCITGKIVALGANVETVQVDDAVACLLAPTQLLSSSVPCFGGVSRFCLLSEFEVVPLPPQCEASAVVSLLPSLLKAFTALHYQAHICAGETVLVTNAASTFGRVAVELASLWGARVLATCDSYDARRCLETMEQAAPCIVDVTNARVGAEGAYVLKRVLDETSGMGVDCVIDDGVEMNDRHLQRERGRESRDTHLLPKRDVISCLGAGARWVTQQANLQLDPPDSEVLFLKGASVAFLFEQQWSLSQAQMGRYRHMMQEALRLIETGQIKASIAKKVDWESVIRVANEEPQLIGMTIFQP